MSENELKKLIDEARDIKKISTRLAPIKEKIRIFLIDSGIKECEGVEIRRSFSSLDLELLRLEKPELFERYCQREEHTITTFNNTITKNNLEKIQEEHPEIWNDTDYRRELTARLYGL